MRTKTLSAALTVVTLAHPAWAQEGGEDPLRLDPVVVESVTRSETPLNEVTRSVTVISREEIDRQKSGDRSVGEILSKTTPGFSPSTEAKTNYGQSLRGRNFLTMVDGVPQSTPLRDGYRSLNAIDANAIERIEVVRGGTAIYGFGASGGLVNIITKKPEDGAFNASVAQGATFSATHPEDSIGTNTELQASGRQGHFDYLVNGSYVMRGGRFDSDGDRIPADPAGVQGGLADSDSYNVLAKFGVDFDDARQRLELTGNRYDFKQDSDWAGVSFAGDPDTGVKTPAVRGNFNPVDPGTTSNNLNLEYTHSSVLGSTVAAQVYYADLDVVFGKWPGWPQTQIVSEKIGSRLTIKTPVELEALPFDITWGADYLRDETSQHATDAADFSPAMEQDAIAGFAQIDLPVANLGLLSGGLRYENITVDASSFTDLNGNPVQGGTLKFKETLFNLTGTVFITDEIDVYGGFSQGFTVADIGRSIRDGTFDNAGQAEGEAQKSDNWELGLRGTFDRWDGTIVGFYSTSDNGTSFDQNLRIVKQPERIWGVEATANVAATDKLDIGGTFTWMKGVVDLDGDGSYEEDLDSTRIPPVKVTAYAEYAFFDWWTARLQGLYSGNRNPNSSQFGGTSDIDEYVVFDLYSDFAVGPGNLQIGIENLFNADYHPVINQAYDQSYAYAEAPGTTVSATYSVKF